MVSLAKVDRLQPVIKLRRAGSSRRVFPAARPVPFRERDPEVADRAAVVSVVVADAEAAVDLEAADAEAADGLADEGRGTATGPGVYRQSGAQ